MASEEKPKTGLELLDDETLAAIVEADIREHNELKTQNACIAFSLLAQRSGIEGVTL